jgi:hypothetical protein
MYLKSGGEGMACNAVTREQLMAALELVILQGVSSADAAVKLGVSKQALYIRLRRLPQYREYRAQKEAEATEIKKKVLVMGRAGYTQASIGRELGISDDVARNWLLKAGIDTTRNGNDNLVCPACGGIMNKQSLFFWLCDSCNSEWWPKEAPDDPDDWTRPWRIRYEDWGKEMLGISVRMLEEGHTFQEICTELNDRGIKTHTGRIWKLENLHSSLAASGINRQGGDRTRIEDITRAMSEKGFLGKDIALRLNTEGLMNSRSKKWTGSGIYKLCKRIGIKLNRGQVIHLDSLGNPVEESTPSLTFMNWDSIVSRAGNPLNKNDLAILASNKARRRSS